MTPPWWQEYIGTPFLDRGRDRAGCDCWGLIRVIYAEQLGIELPIVDGYAHVKDGPGIQAMLDQWLPHWKQVQYPGEWDVALFKAGHTSHVGLMIDDTRMIHVAHGKDACIERYERMGTPTFWTYFS